MKKTNKTGEILSRRGFFKKAAEKALPILGGIALISLPILPQEVKADCSGLCSSGCTSVCTGCVGQCRDGCYNGCTGTCRTGCQGSCESTCSGTCGGGCRNANEYNPFI